MITHAWPSRDIDHINGEPSDNRFVNFREATDSQNLANSRKPRSYRGRQPLSKYKGVTWKRWVRGGGWIAQVRFHGKLYRLGLFASEEAAAAAYEAKAIELFGEFARPARLSAGEASEGAVHV